MLNDLGLSHFWYSQHVQHISSFKHTVKRALQDQYVQNWRSQVHESRSCLNYRIFKDEFQFERYLNDVPFNLAIQFLKFRCRNSKLPVVVGVSIRIMMNVCVICVWR